MGVACGAVTASPEGRLRLSSSALAGPPHVLYLPPHGYAYSRLKLLRITMRGRELPPLRLHEFTAEVLVEALEFHMGRLKWAMNEARDRADRRGWAMAAQRRHELHSVWLRVEVDLRHLGPMSAEDRKELERVIASNGRTMPRSAANAEILKAEMAARREAEEARKARLQEERARHKRFMGIGSEV